MLRAVSGQFVYFDLVSAISGNAVTGASGAISGRKATDGLSGMIVLSGNIIELGGGMYRANLYDFDTSGLYIGYYFTASGCVPRSFSVVTVDASSGKQWPVSGTFSGKLNVNLLSGQSVNVFSGQLSGQAVRILSGQLSGHPVFILSGQLSGQEVVTSLALSSGLSVIATLYSGQEVLVYSGQLSGQAVRILSGQLSGQPVFVLSGQLSGQLVTAASGAFTTASLNSGQSVLVYSGQLSGQVVNLLSGNTIAVLSGTNVNLFSGQISRIVDEVWDEVIFSQGGNGLTARKALTIAAAGGLGEFQVNDESSVATVSGFMSTLSGATDFYNDMQLQFTSGALKGQARVIADYDTNSGFIYLDENLTAVPVSGDFFVVTGPHTHTKTQIAQAVKTDASGMFVTASLNSGQRVLVYSGQLSGHPVSILSGQLSGQPVFILSGQLSGQIVTAASGANVVVPSGLSTIAALYSGQEALVYSGQLSGQKVDLLSGNQVQVWSGTRVNVFSGSLSGQLVTPASGAFTTASLNSGQEVLPYSGSLSGQKVELFSGNTVNLLSGAAFLASGSIHVNNFASGVLAAHIPDNILSRSVSGVQAAMALHGLGSVVLKLTSRFNSLSGDTYRLDGSTVHMSQTPTTQSSGVVPIIQLGVAQ